MALSYFAVARGKRLDLYADRDAANEQLDAFPGSQSQHFSGRESATAYIREHGIKESRIHKSAFQRTDNFTPSQSTPMKQEFKRYVKAKHLTERDQRDYECITHVYDEII